MFCILVRYALLYVQIQQTPISLEERGEEPMARCPFFAVLW